ncbi:MAG: Asp-tRNA(Asn)/Glu-tRNA(Gln) amidotransferase subunit GatB [Burkholderiales bacterium]
MSWEIVIGLETHAQLSTASKMFSGASTAFGAAPNTQASAVDIALPGVLPVANRAAVEHAIRFGLAVNGNINRRSVFARKNYFYPDLPKGYQISQYELPIVQGGAITVFVKDGEKTVRLTRAHLEEDAGKSLHEDFHGMSGIDLNRAGTPLLEIVTEPDMRSSEEAVAYAKALHALVRWIGICDGNMQEGSFRCDANVSVRRPGEPLGTRCEIKNLNSFRFMERAIEFEAKRQIGIIEDGGRIAQETRLYDPDRDETRSMRSKEEAHDYRYFPDPDLPPLEVSEEWIDQVKKSLEKMGTPRATQLAYLLQYGTLTLNDAALLTQSREMAQYFEDTVTRGAPPKTAANWIINDVGGELNRLNIEISEFCVSPGQLARLINCVVNGTINAKTARDTVYKALLNKQGMYAAMWNRDPNWGTAEVDQIIEQQGLAQISDAGAIEKIVDEVLAANAKQVEDYRAGKEKAFNSLVGQVMKASKGKANPAQVNEILKKKLAG